MNGTGSAPGQGTLLDQGFDSATLHLLRERVAACAVAAGMAKGRVPDIILAVHELAANTVLHGAGAGRVLMCLGPGGALSCQVSDTGPGPESWPLRPGHGLWIVREIADQMTVSSGRTGFRVTALFSGRAQSLGDCTEGAL